MINSKLIPVCNDTDFDMAIEQLELQPDFYSESEKLFYNSIWVKHYISSLAVMLTSSLRAHTQ